MARSNFADLCAPGILAGVIFDLDDTLITSPLNLRQIKLELGMKSQDFIIEHIASLSTEAEKNEAWSLVKRHESHAANHAEFMDGASDFYRLVRERGLKTAIWTRNSLATATTVCERLNLKMDKVVTRDCSEPKPNPSGLQSILNEWKIKPSQILFVDDLPLNLEPAFRLGVRTLLIGNRIPNTFESEFIDYDANTFTELLTTFKGSL